MSSLHLPAEAGEVLPDAYPGAVAPSGHIYLDREWTDAMQRRALRSERPHGLDCPCLMCADVRVALGASPLTVDPRSLFATRDGRGREEAV